MSEQHAAYTTNRELLTANEIRKSNSSRLYSDPQYAEPSPTEIKSVIKLCNLSQRETANLVGASSNHKGSTTIRKWCAPVGSAESRPIPYAAWRLLLLHADIVELEKPGQLDKAAQA